MTPAFPFLTAYDPPGSSEGTIDPLGLYPIADELGSLLVPAVRERMQRIRFLTAMTVGAIVTEGLGDEPPHTDAPPYLVWEWLVVEAIIRTRVDRRDLSAMPGTLVASRALDRQGYLDARSYLKTPRIFGFHGTYKRLAIHLGLVNVHLQAGPNSEALLDAWARGLGLNGLAAAGPLLERWSSAVRRSLSEQPPRTKPGWGGEAWAELASAFAPSESRNRERRCLRDLLHAPGERSLGALPMLWRLQPEFSDGDEYREEVLHDRLEAVAPAYRTLLAAIRAYERFARRMQDAFDVLKAVAASADAQGFDVPAIASDPDFRRCVDGLHERFEAAYHALGAVSTPRLSLASLFSERFKVFAEPLDAGDCARALCLHHEAIQRAKSPDGKRPWFDRIGTDRIYVRHAYREPRGDIRPNRYLHGYRGWPIRKFYSDLS